MTKSRKLEDALGALRRIASGEIEFSECPNYALAVVNRIDGDEDAPCHVCGRGTTVDAGRDGLQYRRCDQRHGGWWNGTTFVRAASPRGGAK